MYSGDEKLGRESKDLVAAQIYANHGTVDRVFEKLVGSRSAAVN